MTQNDRREEIKKRLAELDKDIPIEMIARLHSKESQEAIDMVDSEIAIHLSEDCREKGALIHHIGKPRQVNPKADFKFDLNDPGVLDADD